jgi:hypothetical protein
MFTEYSEPYVLPQSWTDASSESSISPVAMIFMNGSGDGSEDCEKGSKERGYG